MLAKDIGIDLGTANVLIYIKGRGIVLNEPSVVVVDTETNKVIAVGEEASEMYGKTPEKLKAIKPMKDGVIADFETTEVMLNHFIKKVNGKNLFSRPRILICCPSNITQVEKNAIKEAAERTGAKKVFLEEEPKVAAIGAGMDISKPSGNMVIDIGGGTTDIAILSLGGIVNSSSIRIAGNAFDLDIVKYIKDKYKLLIGERTAEDIKNVAKQQADQIIKDAESEAKQSLATLEQQIIVKQKSLEDLQKQFDVYKAKMESLLISQLELIKEINKGEEE